MTNIDFVRNRLMAMEAYPGMWSSSKQWFGLQLVLLVEFAQLQSDKASLTKARDVMVKIFGPGASFPDDRLYDAWARAGVAVVRMMLEM